MLSGQVQNYGANKPLCVARKQNKISAYLYFGASIVCEMSPLSHYVDKDVRRGHRYTEGQMNIDRWMQNYGLFHA